MTESDVRQLLANLRLQADQLQTNLHDTQQQLLMTQGAIQALEHLLSGSAAIDPDGIPIESIFPDAEIER